MKLGVVGMMPGTLDEVTPQHLAAIRALDLSGVGMHQPGAALGQVQASTCERVRGLFEDANMDLAQFGVGFGGCLFDADPSVSDGIIEQIGQGVQVAQQLGAHVCLIRTGSLSPNGSYSPSRDNHTPESWARLLDSMRRVAELAEAAEQTVVIETHVLTILNSPEANADLVAAVGSERLRVVMDYVNHFQALHQVYESTARLNHIFDLMGPISAIGHCKDISVRDGFVTHFDEEIPGEGELDLTTALRRWHEMHPDKYMMLEHLPAERYPLAAANVHRILKQEGIPVANG